MSVSNLMQNSRFYTCRYHGLKNSGFKIIGVRHTSSNPKEIVIPRRIPRGPTDILKALASTIRRDPTAPHYKFHDDPYLIPVSNVNKRTFSLAQESGRKAAMWVKEQHPELFQHITAEPPIEAFLSKPRYDEFDELDDTTLLKTIKTASVTDSIQLYELMKKNNIPVSEEIKLCLLELICFFNETEELAEELIEERWFAKTETSILKKTWKDSGYASKLFEELPPSARSYSAIILGMIKFFELEKAIKMYQEAIDLGLALSPNTFNCMIRCANFVRESWPQRFQFIQDVFTKMNEFGCRPSISTLNKYLEVLSRNPNVPESKSLALQMIAELRKFGVEPSLASYHYLLQIFCKSSRTEQSVSFILEDILDLIEGKKFEVQDVNDILFFNTAMDKCRFYYNNAELAFRVNKLLWTGNNYNFIGSYFKESIYYRNFFFTLFQGELLETIMENYNYYVPNIYTPELSVMVELINVVTMNGAVELYPRIWNDMVLFDLGSKNKCVLPLLEGMVLNRPPASDPPAEMSIMLAETAFSIFSKVKTDAETEKWSILDLSNELLGHILTLCLSANDFEKAQIIFEKMLADASKLVGMPSPESLEMYLNACIEKKNSKAAIQLLHYCHENTFGDDRKLAKKVIKELFLGPASKTHLIAMFGQNILDEEVEEAKVAKIA